MRSLGRLAEHLLNIMASTVLFAMVMLTTVDVAGRYVFNAPLRGAFELTELMMAVLICAGLPLVSRREEHVVVDLFEHWMSVPVRHALGVMANLLCAATLMGVAWLLFEKAHAIAGFGDTTAALKITLAPFAYLMATFILCTGLVHVLLIFMPSRPDSGGEGGVV